MLKRYVLPTYMKKPEVIHRGNRIEYEEENLFVYINKLRDDIAITAILKHEMKCYRHNVRPSEWSSTKFKTTANEGFIYCWNVLKEVVHENLKKSIIKFSDNFLIFDSRHIHALELEQNADLDRDIFRALQISKNEMNEKRYESLEKEIKEIKKMCNKQKDKNAELKSTVDKLEKINKKNSEIITNNNKSIESLEKLVNSLIASDKKYSDALLMSKEFSSDNQKQIESGDITSLSELDEIYGNIENTLNSLYED